MDLPRRRVLLLPILFFFNVRWPFFYLFQSMWVKKRKTLCDLGSKKFQYAYIHLCVCFSWLSDEGHFGCGFAADYRFLWVKCVSFGACRAKDLANMQGKFYTAPLPPQLSDSNRRIIDTNTPTMRVYQIWKGSNVSCPICIFLLMLLLRFLTSYILCLPRLFLLYMFWLQFRLDFTWLSHLHMYYWRNWLSGLLWLGNKLKFPTTKLSLKIIMSLETWSCQMLFKQNLFLLWHEQILNRNWHTPMCIKHHLLLVLCCFIGDGNLFWGRPCVFWMLLLSNFCHIPVFVVSTFGQLFFKSILIIFDISWSICCTWKLYKVLQFVYFDFLTQPIYFVFCFSQLTRTSDIVLWISCRDSSVVEDLYLVQMQGLCCLRCPWLWFQ